MRLSTSVQLIAALLLAGSAGAVDVKTATHQSSSVWRYNESWFGGFSALHISDDGSEMIALSDRAMLVKARIHRDQGIMSGIELLEHWPVLSSTGGLLKGRAGDSEGIAFTQNGSFFISFEGVHRVAHYPSSQEKAHVLPRPNFFGDLEGNGSFEGLAIDKLGRVYAVTETSRSAQGEILVFRWDGHTWETPFGLPPRGRFKPVAADFGPDGRLYVLERSISPIGFRSRLRRWQLKDDVPMAEEILFETDNGAHDNLEGLSVWEDSDGLLRATMISDDNFLALQSTELVEYLLPD